MHIKDRFNQVSEMIVRPEIISDMKKYIKLNKEYKDLETHLTKINQYLNLLKNIDEADEIIKNENDPELKELARQELEESTSKKSIIDSEIKILLIPNDPDDSKNAVVEIRAGSGGDEASIFAGDLFRITL